MRVPLLCLSLLVAACYSVPPPTPANPSSAPVTGEPTGGSSTQPDPTLPPADPAHAPADPAQGSAAATGPGIGESCGPRNNCAPTLECLSYRGIAGARGPEFKTCEIRCEDDTTCPAGRKCNTIADGPGRVCR